VEGKARRIVRQHGKEPNMGDRKGACMAAMAIGWMGLAGCASKVIGNNVSASTAQSEPSTETDDGFGVPPAFFRLAEVRQSDGAIDICLRPHGCDASAPFDIGPLLAAQGLIDGLSYRQVSAYIAVAPGTYDVRFVGPGSDCNAKLSFLGNDISYLPALASGSYSTFLENGDPHVGSVSISVLTDEREVSPGQSKIRFVNAAHGLGNVDLGLGAGDSFSALFTDVAFLGSGADVDANGYLETAPTCDQPLVLRSSGGTTDLLTVPGFSLAEGRIQSVFAAGEVGRAGLAVLSMFLCNDGTALGVGLTDCAVVAP